MLPWTIDRHTAYSEELEVMFIKSDGYFVMLKPLSTGEHEIRSTGSLAEVTVEGTQNFVSDVVYHVTVE